MPSGQPQTPSPRRGRPPRDRNALAPTPNSRRITEEMLERHADQYLRNNPSEV